MDACKGCGKDMERVSTHWAGCHEHHPECAAYREGFRAGMRAAAEHAYWLFINKGTSATAVEVRDAIRAEAYK